MSKRKRREIVTVGDDWLAVGGDKDILPEIKYRFGQYQDITEPWAACGSNKLFVFSGYSGGYIPMPSQGDGNDQREGSRIDVLKIKVVLHIPMTTAVMFTTDTWDHLCLGGNWYLVWDKQVNNTAPTALSPANLFFAASNAMGSPPAYGMRNPVGLRRFEVLDKVVVNGFGGQGGNTLGVPMGFTASGQCPFAVVELNWNGVIPVSFAGTGNAAANIIDNGFLIMTDHCYCAPQAGAEMTLEPSRFGMRSCVAYVG